MGHILLVGPASQPAGSVGRLFPSRYNRTEYSPIWGVWADVLEYLCYSSSTGMLGKVIFVVIVGFFPFSFSFLLLKRLSAMLEHRGV